LDALAGAAAFGVACFWPVAAFFFRLAALVEVLSIGAPVAPVSATAAVWVVLVFSVVVMVVPSWRRDSPHPHERSVGADSQAQICFGRTGSGGRRLPGAWVGL
jgi:hypothetical protein